LFKFSRDQKTCEKSAFDLTYYNKDACLLIKGEVSFTDDGEQPVRFALGDLVVFPVGTDCRLDVHKGVRKHYRLAD